MCQPHEPHLCGLEGTRQNCHRSTDTAFHHQEGRLVRLERSERLQAFTGGVSPPSHPGTRHFDDCHDCDALGLAGREGHFRPRLPSRPVRFWLSAQSSERSHHDVVLALAQDGRMVPGRRPPQPTHTLVSPPVGLPTQPSLSPQTPSPTILPSPSKAAGVLPTAPHPVSSDVSTTASSSFSDKHGRRTPGSLPLPPVQR